MGNPIFVTLVVLTVAYTFSEVFRLFKIPRVVGQIAAGIILGIPVLKGELFTSDSLSLLSFISNIGIILLFFFVGLEIDFKKFRKNFKESSFIAIFNTLIPLLVGFAVSKFGFNFSSITSIIIGISLSVSSQAISLDILEELNLLKSKIGNLIIASGTVDDVFELLLISCILILFHSAALGNASFYKLLLDIVSFTAIVIIFKILLIPFALKIFEREKSRSNLFMGSLILVLLMAYLSELLGIGSLIGALIAGILVRQTFLREGDRKPWRINELSHSIHIIAFGFLIPIFFVNVGLQTDISSISSNLFLVFILVVIDIFGTLAGTIIGVLLSRGSFKEGMLVGWAVIPKGDTEIVIASLALNGGLINIGIFTAIITVALISTLLSPIVFRFLVKKYNYNVPKNAK